MMRAPSKRTLTAAQDRCCIGLCEGPIECRGLCRTHYKRLRRHGVLYSPKKIAGLRSQQERSRSYYLANRETLIARVQARRWADPEKARAHEREIRARRAVKHRADARARERNLGTLDADSRSFDAILRCDPCSYCAAPADQVDHIEPVARGGANHWTNLTAACRRCNRAKSDKPLLLHLAGAGR